MTARQLASSVVAAVHGIPEIHLATSVRSEVVLRRARQLAFARHGRHEGWVAALLPAAVRPPAVAAKCPANQVVEPGVLVGRAPAAIYLRWVTPALLLDAVS